MVPRRCVSFLRVLHTSGIERTSIEIDDDLFKAAMEALGSKTKRAAVEAALRRVVDELRREVAIRELRGVGWEGNLEEMREGRYGE